MYPREKTTRIMHLVTILLLASLQFEVSVAQVIFGEYPSIASVATYRPVTASSVCGANGAEAFCSYTTDAAASLEPNCMGDICNNTCPHSSSSPPPVSISTLGTFGPGVTTAEGRPGSPGGALRFNSSFVAISPSLVPLIGDRGFSFNAWIRQELGNEGTLISKSSSDGLERNYVISVSESSITLDYLPDTLDTSSLPPEAERYRSVSIDGLSLSSSYWHHIGVTVYAEDAVFYVNGTVVGVQTLEGDMVDSTDSSRTVFLGQTIESVGYYNGLMQEVYFYAQALTARELMELATGIFPFVHLSSECHCPPSHPLIDTNNEANCIQHIGGSINRGSMGRINPIAHPPGYINDFGAANGWISAPNEREVNVSVVLTHSLYELIFINVRYGSPRPKAAILETSKDDGQTYQPIQYFSDDCLFYFGLQDNGPIVNADDVNCVTMESMQTPTSNSDVRTRLLDPVTRPFDLNTSPELREFILATHLRLRLIDFFNESTTPLHRYYSILEITVAARCACNGHSSRCGSDIDSICQCQHNSDGDTCERCLPLYNDKPWRYGTTSNGFPCKLCECNNHATSCHYNASVDPFPDSYEVGGGGVCDDCQDDTAGQQCEMCRYGYYRPPGRQPNDSTPCEECGCDMSGVIDDGDCVKSEDVPGEVAGQCFCKENVMGLKCDTCKVGFYSLMADNPDGCMACECNTIGTFMASETCNSDSGQCICKSNVIGLKCDQCRNGTTGLNALNPSGCSECNCNPTGSLSNDCDPVAGVCLCKQGVDGDLCDQCLPGFYDFSDAGCQPCSCHPNGAISDVCDAVTGECSCGANVNGTNCDSCASGFYNISAGCAPCGCVTAGTVNGSDTCDTNSGECSCKPNVEGRTCDTCSTGFTNLTDSSVEGCSECDCFEPNTDTTGTICDPVTSQCECLPSATGLKCDSCLSGFYDFLDAGCQPCSCHPIGAISDVCDAVTGECSCGANVNGTNCDSCASGFYNISAGCAPCGCVTAGTVNGSNTCDTNSGDCSCKPNVEGRTCDTCSTGFTNLTDSSVEGCSECDCFEPNTDTTGTICDPVTSQCECLPSATGLKCDSCLSGFYSTADGCVLCDCDVNASINSTTCDVVSGQCMCAGDGVGGRRCDSCRPGFFQFPSCSSCGCDPAGAQSSMCDPVTGECMCKEYVMGDTCDACIPGFEMLDAGNPFGCSAAPDEQAPPLLTPLNSTTIQLTWLEPEAPNGVILGYNIYRDGVSIATTSSTSYIDTGLTPDTEYLYSIEAFNVIGSTRSVSVSSQTEEGIPTGLVPPTLTTINSTAVAASWQEPAVANGAITRYELVLVAIEGEPITETVVFTGLAFSAIITDLRPFTLYSFEIRACTTGGCGSSESSQVLTGEATPTFQPAPNVTTLSATSLGINWGVPPEPNGIVTHYAIYQRNTPFVGDGFLVGNVSSDTFSFVVGGLHPFMTYEFSVVSYTSAGGTRSEWVAGETAQSVPEDVQPPLLTPLSPSSIQVNWTEPQTLNGIVTLYNIYSVSLDTGNRMLLLISSDVGSHVVEGLQPFTEYGFLVEACTAVGCNESDTAAAFTLESAPIGQSAPMVTNQTATSISLMWESPLDPNGIISNYIIQQRRPSLTPSPSIRDVGISFEGTGFAAFASANLGGFSNEITLRFRTLSPTGTIIYYINSARTDLLAIELRNGIPWFLFDAGSGPAAVRPVDDVTFNDGLWHELTVSQSGAAGSITVDGVYTGSGESIGTDQVLSSNQALYVGGIGSDLPLTTVNGNLNPNATLSGNSFAGCLFAVNLNGELLDFSTQTASSFGVGPETLGCPIGVEPSIQYLGGGYLKYPENTIHSSRFTFTFDFRTTDSRGVLFFVYNNADNSSLGVEIQDSVIRFAAQVDNMRFETLIESVVVCDGLWHSLLIEQSGDEVSVVVDGQTGSLALLPRVDVIFSSGVFLGGVPLDSSAFQRAEDLGVDLYTPFSGCTRASSPNLFVDGIPFSPQPEVSAFVRFDGCRDSPGAACSAPWTNLNVGQVMMYTDGGLNPFTDYLYRVSPMNTAGSTFSPWVAAMTRESAPTEVGTVQLLSSTESTLTLTWERPAAPNGLITSYDITAVPVATVGFTTPLGGPTMATVVITEPEMPLLATLTALFPATTYSLVLTAYTTAAGGSGLPVALTTMESVPLGVQPPFVTSATSRSLDLAWTMPTQPNGIIIRYDLFLDNELQFSGLTNSTTIQNLDPFTDYTFHLQACTSVGCSNSSENSSRTLPDSPTGLAAPNLTVLSPSSVQAVWSQPTDPNGEIIRFELHRFLGRDLSQMDVVFSGLDLETTATGLTPNTLYAFQLLVFNAGGSAASPTVEIQTPEDIPDGISAPAIEVINSTALLVTWQQPTQPNGNIIRYILTQNGFIVFDGLLLSYLATNLEPFTAYSYAIMACTEQGCGSSNHSTASTLEAVPEGYVQPTVTTTTANSFTLRVNAVTNPNGLVRYILDVTGEFALSSVTKTRTVYNSSEPGIVQVDDLLPFTNYDIILTVTNSAGTLTGDTFIVQTSPTAPEGLAAPTLTLLNATTLLVQWMPPSNPNGVILSYQLTLVNSTHILVSDEGLQTSATVGDLRPFTLYEVFVSVNNTEGSVDSPRANITTGETAPLGFDQAVIIDRGSRYILISWDPPAARNGILINYTVIQGDTDTVLAPTVLEYNVTGLLPFTEYTFFVVVCTAAGCVENPSVTTITREDVPEEVPPPFVTDSIPGTVVISWEPPTTPNGIILQYYIQRAPGGTQNFTQLGAVLGNVSLVFVDATIVPFTLYEYRIVAVNSVGQTAGPPQEFRTPEAAPSGVLPPALSAQSSSEVEIRFRPPLIPNGILSSYALTRSTPTASPVTLTLNISILPTENDYFIYTDTNLLPFTNYTYILTVCTGGGCTDSTPVWVVTLEDTPQGISTPTAISLNSSTILVSWQEPTQPNGVIVRYTVLRRSLGFYNSTAGLANCCEEYVVSGNASRISQECDFITETVPDVTSYTDTTLQAFSFYQYCTVVTNGADSGYSEFSFPTQTDPAPMPLVGPALNATTINSTAIQLYWGSLEISELLGPLEGYTLYGQIAGSPGLGDVLFTGLEQSYVATGLIASTEYIFVVSVSNGRGDTLGNSASATTEEGIPANLSAPDVLALSATSLSITWMEPQQPNGVIVSYIIFLDSLSIHNSSQPDTLVVNNLTPFTLYTVQVEACTMFGCTRSPLVAETTLESPPEDLASPVVVVTGPTSVNVSWREPLILNGIITQYRLYLREGTEEQLIFSGLDFEYVVDDLRPFTTYGFRVVVFNSAGNESSGSTMIQTDPAAPSFVDPPATSVLSATEISLSWTEPAELNGMLTGYQIYRDDSLILTTLSTFYTDTNLDPFSQYSYILEVCTNGGCTNSSAVTNTTLEALPEGVSNPNVSGLQPRSLVVNWQPPTRPNGIITDYILTLTSNNTILFRGLALTLPLTDLTPYTIYSFQLSVCNSIGCTLSEIVDIQTPETDPEGFGAPSLRNINSTSVDISWNAPTMPNGNITRYTVRRGTSGSQVTIIVFEGLTFSYIDTNLVPSTQYSYTVEAVNGGGSLESPVSSITTVADLADDIDLPTLDVLAPTSIRVTWSEPGSPNGVISNYILFMDDVAVFTGLAFEYMATDLTPFTVYTFYLMVCNQAGCASTPDTTAITDAAPPEGVSPPLLAVLGPTAIQVSWETPTMPNGIITRYEVRRRLIGDPFESIQYIGGPSVLSFPNSGLDPFTMYEYRLGVTNEAGTTFSERVSATTSEDRPEGVGAPVFVDSDVFARNATATWSPPTNPNGILLSYRLEYRLLLDPTTNMPGVPVVAEEVSADITTASATGLTPVTSYEFRVVAINGAGEGVSDWVDVLTAEDIPEDLQPIVVEERTGTTLTLSWTPPLTSNGVILEYMLLLDEELVYRDAPNMYVVLRLQPFTSYTLQLGACTSAGCAFGEIQSATTAEVDPFGQPSPSLTALSPRSVNITWNPPAQPNGIITMYEILRQDDGNPSSLVVIFSTSDVVTMQYIDVTVLPASDYEYAIRTINSVGETLSDFRSITTPDAPPEGLTAPTLTVQSSTSIGVTWAAPTQPNGVITEYQVFRNGGGGVNESVYVGQNRGFTDENLQPFTQYSYTLQACTLGGCSLSASSSETTFEDLPEEFDAPILISLSATEIAITWSPPSKPNGVITSYIVIISPVDIQVTTTDLARNITNLNPYTLYAVTIDACNSVGCVQSGAEVRTDESTPQFIGPPQLMAINATAVQVEWQEPTRPNGIITRYELRRNGSLVLTAGGNTTSFTDVNLSPSQKYSYTIQAYTSIGGGEESISRIVQTLQDTPDGISPPDLEVLGPNTIRARWSIPSDPNGVIQSYRLQVNGTVVFESLVFEGLAFEIEVNNLLPFTVYEFRLDVCTTTCGSSATVIAMTAEAPPQGQAPPQLTPNPDTTVTVVWNYPSQPNGEIIRFELERKPAIAGNFSLIFTGLDTFYLDDDPALEPATSYVYRLTSVNGAGVATSDTIQVVLLDAAPEDVIPPQFQSITSRSLTAVIFPPGVPNGQIILYRLYQNGTQVNETSPDSQDSPVTFQVSGLQPFMWYGFHTQVCTSGGCNTSAVVAVRTAEAPSTGLDPPTAEALSPRMIRVDWTAPSQPNGIILRYILWYRLPCQQPVQPIQSTCTEDPPRELVSDNIPANQLTYDWVGSGSSDPIPYSSYQFQIEAENSAGRSDPSPFSSDVQTPATDPEVIQGAVFTETDQVNNVIFLDWSQAFRLNGNLQVFSVIRNGFIVYQTGTTTNATLLDEPLGIPLEYVITVTTNVATVTAQASTEIYRLQLELDIPTPPGNDSGTMETPTPDDSSDDEFYETAPFIIGMVLLGIAILLVVGGLFLCCIKPKGEVGYKVGGMRMDPTPTPTPTKSGYKHMYGHEPVTGSWSPGDPTWEDVPDLGDEEAGPVIVPESRSYFPKRVEKAPLLDNEETLRDTHISGFGARYAPTPAAASPRRHASPVQHHFELPATDDFGSFKAHHTTFQDTKV